jgi:hypothetical protein
MIRVQQWQCECAGLNPTDIHRDKSESGASDSGQHLRTKRIADGPDQICGRQLDPGDVVVMSNSQFGESELSQRRLGAFDLAEFGRRNQVVVWNP